MVIIRLRDWVRNGFNPSEILSLSHSELCSWLNRPAPTSRGCLKRLKETLFLLGRSLLHIMGSFNWAKPLGPLGEDTGAHPSSGEGDLGDLQHPGELAKRCGVHDGKVGRARRGTRGALGAAVSWFKANVTQVAAILSLGRSTDRPKAMDPGSLPRQFPAGCLW